MPSRKRHPKSSLGAAQAAQVIREDREPTASDGPSVFALPTALDAGRAGEALEMARQWFAGLDQAQPGTVILQEPDNVLAVQLAAAIVKSAQAIGLAVAAVGPDGAPVAHIRFAPNEEAAA